MSARILSSILVFSLLPLACGGSATETTDNTTTAATSTGEPDPTTSVGTSSDTGAVPTTGEPTTTGSSTTAPDPTTSLTADTGDATSTGTTGAPIDPPTSLDDIVDGEPEVISEGHIFTEGPVWRVEESSLLFSDVQANTIYRWTEGEGSDVLIMPSDNSNGLDFDMLGRLVAAEHGKRRVSRRELGMDATGIVDQFEGKKLNSPNDLVVRSDGTIYFTDPPYGIAPQDQEQPFQGVFRVDPQGAISLIADDFDRPNGIVLSPDESVLYVDDTATEQVRSFAVMPGGEVTGGEVFIDLTSDLEGNPDGMTVDAFGDLYVSGGGGVRVVTPGAELLGTIVVPDQVTNCTFGDPDGKALFMTTPTKVYRVRLKVAGVGIP